MSHYMLLVYEEQVDPAVQAEHERELPVFLEMHRSLREAGLLVGVQRLRSVESATSVRVRDGETEITDGPFAVTKRYWPATTSLTAPTSTRRSGTLRACPSRAGRRWRCARSCRPTSG